MNIFIIIYFILDSFSFVATLCGLQDFSSPWPGIEPGPLAVKTPSPDRWTSRKFLAMHILTEKQGPQTKSEG